MQTWGRFCLIKWLQNFKSQKAIYIPDSDLELNTKQNFIRFTELAEKKKVQCKAATRVVTMKLCRTSSLFHIMKCKTLLKSRMRVINYRTGKALIRFSEKDQLNRVKRSIPKSKNIFWGYKEYQT